MKVAKMNYHGIKDVLVVPRVFVTLIVRPKSRVHVFVN